jgi:serine/threonine protein kinase
MANRYMYMRKLGKGSQGQVWLAQRNSDNELVAIKQLNIHSVTTWKMYELFKREANILENLNIQGVVPFYEYVEDLQAQPPFVCIVQKFIDGQTLAEMLKSKHRFETETIYDIITQILKILEKLHTHHPPVIHRDIKPSNLMLTATNDHRYTVTLLDFGAVANPQVQNGGSTVAGTFGYMPPEQLMGQAQPASDIYALAAVAVELLSGTSPADIPACDFKLVIEPYL